VTRLPVVARLEALVPWRRPRILNGLLIERHFLTADALGVPREQAMRIMREELWTRDKPIADRVQAATERLREEAL
jgi:hypothetical protein